MRTLVFIAMLALIPAVGHSEIISKHIAVYFASDDDGLDEAAQSGLLQFLAEVDASGDFEFIIQGHTDQQGNHEYNNDLSARRARNVKNFLAAQGVSPRLLLTESYGKQQLLLKSQDAASMSKNRRVEVIYKRYKIRDREELMSVLASSAHHTFQFEASSRQTVKCTKGSRIHIPAHAFVHQNGMQYSGVVRLEVIEALDFDDFFAHGLTTLSDGALLQSGGMMKIQALADDGSELVLAEEAALQIAIPQGQNGGVQGMSMFISEDGRDWSNTQQPARSRNNLDIPEKPELSYPTLNLYGRYFDENNKPRYPGMPMKPVEPVAPRYVSFEQKVKWYQFFRKNQIQQKNTARYLLSWGKYEEKRQKYERDLLKYEEYRNQHPEWVLQYEAKLSKWEAERLAYLYQDSKEKHIILENHVQESDRRRELYELQLAEWEETRKEKQAEYDGMLDRLGFPKGANPRYYLFENAGLGWINADKLYKPLVGGMSEVLATVNEFRSNAAVMAVLPDISSILNMDPVSAMQYTSAPLPKKERIVIVAYVIESDGIKLASKPAVRGDKMVELEYKSVTVNEFRNYLRELKV